MARSSSKALASQATSWSSCNHDWDGDRDAKETDKAKTSFNSSHIGRRLSTVLTKLVTQSLIDD